MTTEIPSNIPDLAAALAMAYGGVPDDEDIEAFLAAPPVPPPVVEDKEPCSLVDPMSGAVCSRGQHPADLMHWFEDQDFRIQWREMTPLYVHGGA